MNIQGIAKTRFAVAVSALVIGLPGILSGCGGTSTAQGLTLSPASASVAPGSTVKFTATPFNSIAFTPVYRIAPQTGVNVGTIDPDGTYHAPTSVPPNFTATITASSANGNITSNTATVSVKMGVTISPTSAQVSVQRTLQFYASVAGDPKNQVKWTVVQAAGIAGGSIDANGLYSAPKTIAQDGLKDTIEARSVVDNTLAATATVTVVVADPVNINVQ